MRLSILAEIPALTQTVDGMESVGWPLYSGYMSPSLAILDLIEFCYKHVAYIKQATHHGYFGHRHLTFDVETGQEELRQDINTMFRRNGSIYKLDYYGAIQRIGSAVITNTVKHTVFQTGDSELNTLLEQAREKYLDRHPKTRLESLYPLWSALERMKTIEHQDKKTGARLLIAKSSSTRELAEVMEAELVALTRIGNTFKIRHREVGTIGVDASDIDYLFHRAFTTVAHLLDLKARVRA